MLAPPPTRIRLIIMILKKVGSCLLTFMVVLLEIFKLCKKTLPHIVMCLLLWMPISIEKKSERECHVLSADPISCPEAGLTQHGYNLTVEVMGSQCGVLNRESCPNDLHITESTTIPCYLDDRDCVFGFDVPSIPLSNYIWSVVLSCLLLVNVLMCLVIIYGYFVYERPKKIGKRQQEIRRNKNSSNKNLF
eukprot:TRINITY_DN1543_c0_g1_i4.p2 TRINITY_DN1543_c0_g1~~TRINITY_DN1543_c0_g1_i4.p2  ORF type:complete len:191 (+),score=19.72 TRINITY_DN1543_c0_g1_i4:49-621(+)